MEKNRNQNSGDIPEIPLELAEKTLENVFNACNKEPNKKSILALKGEYLYSIRMDRAIKILAVTALVMLVLSPLAFIRPHLKIATESIEPSRITMNIEVSKIVKPLSVQATVDGQSIPLTQLSDSLYLAEITENGEFEAAVTGLNGQISRKTAEISNLKEK